MLDACKQTMNVPHLKTSHKRKRKTTLAIESWKNQDEIS